MRRFLTLFCLCALALLPAACADNSYDLDGNRRASSFDKPLVSYNYAAIDALMSRAGKNINKNTPMLVGTVGDVNNVETSSTLGRTITEQLSARLAQKNYKVAELKLRQGINVQEGGFNPAGSGEYLLSRDVRNISGEHKAAAAVTGTYAIGADSVLVNLRLIDIRSGNVITAYDYVLPKTADIAAMTRGGSTKDSFFSVGTFK